jgi:endo-1,4-beta-xylanase
MSTYDIETHRGAKRTRRVRSSKNRQRSVAVAVAASFLVGSAVFFVNDDAGAQSVGLQIETLNNGTIDERWSGSIQVPVDGLYQFVVSGDPSDVRIDGVQLVDYWQDSSHDRFGKLQLSAGVAHDVVIEVRAVPGPTNQKLKWSGPSFGRREVPASVLSPNRGNVRAESWEKSLKDNAAQRGVLIGTAVDPNGLNDSKYTDLLKREFSLAPPEWAFSAAIETNANQPLKSSGVFVDPILAVTEANGQQSQAFHLLWHEFSYWNPELANRSLNERRAFAKSHVQTLMRKYSGRVQAWNVMNEAFRDDGSLRQEVEYTATGSYKNWLFGISNDLLGDSFRWAREADPNALLFYNDYGIEADGPKWDAVLNMVKRFKREGVPIDGVGFQGHLDLTGNPNGKLDALNDHFRQLNELGVRVRITELDVSIGDGRGSEALRLEAQARLVWQATTACMHAQNCDAINMWGMTDSYNWKTRPEFQGKPENQPTLFDTSFNPKPAYWWMQHALIRPVE